MYTGERILNKNIFSVTYQQSLLAYEFAKKISAGKTVIDIACGEGYGPDLLATTASRVIGLDYDTPTINQARRRYKRPNLQFITGNLFNIDQCVGGIKSDVVCSFQTIEHFIDHDAFIQAIKSAGKPGGTVVITTPNKNVFPSYNPYHLHELDYVSLKSLLEKHFESYEIYGIFGDNIVRQYRHSKQKIGDFILRLDYLNMRAHLPKPIVKSIYRFVSHDIIKRLSWLRHKQQINNVTLNNFVISESNVDQALDFLAVGGISKGL